MINQAISLTDEDKPYHLSIDKAGGIVQISFHGVMRLKELVDSFSEIIRHPDFEVNMSACYDLSNAMVDLDLKQTEIFFHFASGLRGKRGDSYKISFVYGDNMARMLVNFYQLFLAHSQIEIYITENSVEALDWLSH